MKTKSAHDNYKITIHYNNLFILLIHQKLSQLQY